MFIDSTPFLIALVVTFCVLICVVIWNNINAPLPPQKAPPIESGPSRTREILARFSDFYTNLNPEGEMIFDVGILPDPKQHHWPCKLLLSLEVLCGYHPFLPEQCDCCQ